MEKAILIRYGEIFLKGKNRYFFESCLIKNIKNALKSYDFEFNQSQGRYTIENYDENNESVFVNILTKVFGIHSISLATKVKTDLELISKVSQDIMPNENLKYRVTVKRADKRLKMTSTEIASQIGGDILQKKSNLKVDLFNYDIELFIDIRENGFSYIFTDKIECSRGMPVGCSGKGLLLLSGGIDSPVAGYMMAKRGLSLDAVHFHSMPYTSEMAKEKVVDLAKIISPYTGHINLKVVPFTAIQEAIHQNCPPEFMITIMRRIMMRISEKIAKDNNCGAIITGESLGQVASQTLQSISVTDDAIENMPILRPLIGMDKAEIIEISNKIGTYETSILPYQDCCTLFLPKNPATKPNLKIVKKAELSLDLDKLINDAINNIELIII